MKDIKGYEGLYAVTSCGKVWSYKKQTFLNPMLTEKGYLRVALYKDGKYKFFRVHRLVAEAFIPNPDNKPEVNHRDEIKSHNWVNNLEWCDRIYNNNYGARNEKASKSMIDSGANRKPVMCIETGHIYASARAVANNLGVDESAISQAVRRNGRCKGYHWRYIDESDRN